MARSWLAPISACSSTCRASSRSKEPFRRVERKPVGLDRGVDLAHQLATVTTSYQADVAVYQLGIGLAGRFREHVRDGGQWRLVARLVVGRASAARAAERKVR